MLLDARIYVIAQVRETRDTSDFSIKAGDTLSLAHWTGEDGAAFIPFFSSLEALQQSVEGEVGYLTFSARELFASTRGKQLVLNPGQPQGKVFLPPEIDALLTQGIAAPVAPAAHEAEPPVEIGVPADYPVELVEGLTRLFAQHGAIKRAYLALLKDSSARQPFSLLVGLELDKPIDLQSIGIGHVTTAYAPDTMPVDILVLDETEDDGPSRYFREQAEPFYERSWGQRLRAFFVRP
jgi:hypothetical protein